MNTYKRLLSAARHYWAIFTLGVLGTVLMSLVDAGLTWMIKPIVNQGFINRDALFIHWLPLVIVMCFLMRGVASFASTYFVNRVARNVVRDFRRRLFQKLLRLPATFFDHHSSGHLLSTIIYNVEQVATASSSVLLTVLREGSLVIGLVFVMFTVSWQLSLLFLGVAPLIGWVVRWSGLRLRRLSHNVQQAVGDVTQVASEAIESYKVIRLYGGEQYEKSKFDAATRRNQQRELKIVITNSLGTSSVQLLIAVPIAVTLAIATLPSLHVTAGSFAAVVTAMVTLLRPMRRATMVNSEIQKGVAAAASIFAILDEPVEEDTGTLSLKRAKGFIEYRGVSFRYHASSPRVLHNITFQIEPGQRIALVGRSGSGKTTLVNLLPRFYEVQAGAITCDGQDIRHYQLSDLRQQFAMVTQDTTLFDDTIANNIRYGLARNITDQEIEQAAEAAHAMEFIVNLPHGIHTRIGEDGVLLSGGQRQRLAIARAILKQAPLLILDEATSALDTHAERHIQQALDRLMQHCTSLVIAHRLSTIESADRILVLDKGHIVEQGTHQQLLRKDGAYAELYRMQFQHTESGMIAS